MINTILLIISIIITFIFLNLIIFILRNLYFKFSDYILRLPSYLLTFESYLSKDNKSDCFILKNAYANRNDLEFKFMLDGLLHLLGEVYSDKPNQQFTFLLVFSEVPHNSDIHKIISNLCFFNYNVNNPLTVNELFNLIKFNESAYINNNKDVVITIKTI